MKKGNIKMSSEEKKPRIRSVMFNQDVIEIGMTFKMGMAGRKDAYALQVTKIELDDGAIFVYVKQLGGVQVEQLWRNYPIDKCALEYELLIDIEHPYKDPKIDLGHISLDHTHP